MIKAVDLNETDLFLESGSNNLKGNHFSTIWTKCMIAFLWLLLYSNNQLLKYILIIVFKKHVHEVVLIFQFLILALNLNVLLGGWIHDS